MPAQLHPVEARVAASLLEKEITTPEYYPLTLNALVAACNQKSNRDPVVSYDEDTVRQALESLQSKRFAATIIASGSRVPKYEQRLASALNLGRRESALIGVLMLRGPQTLGELRERAGRLYNFADTDEVELCLQRLANLNPPLATQLARQPGMKEPRYAHLLCGEPDWNLETPSAPTAANTPISDRLGVLEEEVRRLREEMDDLKRQFFG